MWGGGDGRKGEVVEEDYLRKDGKSGIDGESLGLVVLCCWLELQLLVSLW